MRDSGQKGYLKSNFEQSAEGKLLYHCIPVTPEGNEIRPSLGYGAEIPKETRDKLGISPTEKAPLVFASDYMSKALAFGLQGTDNEKLLNAEIEGTDAEMVFVCNRDVTMKRERSGALYSFPAAGFADLDSKARQLVSNKPVPFSKTKNVMDIKNADDLMRAGLQIFSFKETFQILHEEKMADKIMCAPDLYAGIAKMIKDGRIVWENQARGINPYPVLAERLGMKPAAPQPKP